MFLRELSFQDLFLKADFQSFVLTITGSRLFLRSPNSLIHYAGVTVRGGITRTFPGF